MSTWKDIVLYSTAVVSLTSGVILSFFSYFDQGDILSGVLGYVAQTLMYAAAIFGATLYWNGKYNELRSLVLNGNFNVVDSSLKKAR